MQLLLHAKDFGQIYLLDAKERVESCQAFAAADANDMVPAFHLGNDNSRLRLQGVQFLGCDAEVDASGVNAVLLQFKHLAASLRVGNSFGLNSDFDFSIALILANLNAEDAVALLVLPNAGTLGTELLQR